MMLTTAMTLIIQIEITLSATVDRRETAI